MGIKKKAKNMGSTTVQNAAAAIRDTKTTSTRKTSSKPVATVAAKVGAQTAKKATAASPAKTTYYAKKKTGGVIGTGRAVARRVPFSTSKAPTIRNIVNPAAIRQTVTPPYYRTRPNSSKAWGIDFANDFGRDQMLWRSEDYTPEYRLLDESPFSRMKNEADLRAEERRGKYYSKKLNGKNIFKQRTNDYRVLKENPLKQLEASAPAARRSYRERYGYNITPHSVMGRIKAQAEEAAEREKWLKQRRDELAPFRDWVNLRTDFTSPEEDKGTTLAQVNRLASLYGAVYPTTKGYTPEQAREIQEQIRSAPVGLQDLIIKHGDQLSPIRYKEGDNAYFRPGTGRVYGDPSVIAEDNAAFIPYSTHWHEYGHNLDWLSKRYGNQPLYSNDYTKDGKGLNDIIAEDWDRTLRDYWDTFKSDKGPYNAKEAAESFGIDMMFAYPRSEGRERAVIGDILSPYSVEHGGDAFPMGYGHYSNYWLDHPDYKTTEAFADITSASVTGGDELRYVQAFLPNTYDAYLDMLRKMQEQDPTFRPMVPQK